MADKAQTADDVRSRREAAISGRDTGGTQLRGQAALVEASKIVFNLRVPAQRSFLLKPRLAQAFGTLRNVLRVLAKPFDGEARIDAKGFGHVRLRLVHLAQERIRSREVCVVPVIAIARVERLFIFDD